MNRQVWKNGPMPVNFQEIPLIEILLNMYFQHIPR